MKPYFNKYGLINAWRAEGVAENSPLWGYQYYLMTKDPKMLKDLNDFIDSCKVQDGLYNQRPAYISEGSDVAHDKYMSPDQLIAFAGALYKAGRIEELKAMFKWLRDHKFTYDNISRETNFDRLMQIEAPAFVAACSSKWHRIWAYPVLFLDGVYACIVRPDETSGRLKTWTMFETLDMRFSKAVCTQLNKVFSKFKTWSGCFIEYFGDEIRERKDHPIRVIAESREL